MTQGVETKVSSFDGWLKSKKIRTDKDGRDYIDGFARASHCGWLVRQEEVSKLQAEIDDSENTRAVLYRENMDLRESNIELQKQIDEALKALEKLDGYDYNENLDAVFLILKGESND